MKKIEQRSAAELEKAIVTVEKRVDGEVAKLKTRLDEQVADIAKKLRARQAAAGDGADAKTEARTEDTSGTNGEASADPTRGAD